MKTSLIFLVSALLVSALCSDIYAQAFMTDNDGLLDVGETPGFPLDPANAMGTLRLSHQNIEDLDGTDLLTNLDRLVLRSNKITGIEEGFQRVGKLTDSSAR